MKADKNLCRANAYGDLPVSVLAKSQFTGLLYLTVLCACALIFMRNCAKIGPKTPKKMTAKTGYFSHSNGIF